MWLLNSWWWEVDFPDRGLVEHSEAIMKINCIDVIVSPILPVWLSIFSYSLGYNTVVRIPAGATNIDIKQVSYSGKPEDDNYLGEFAACVFQANNVIFKQC